MTPPNYRYYADCDTVPRSPSLSLPAAGAPPSAEVLLYLLEACAERANLRRAPADFRASAASDEYPPRPPWLSSQLCRAALSLRASAAGPSVVWFRNGTPLPSSPADCPPSPFVESSPLGSFAAAYPSAVAPVPSVPGQLPASSGPLSPSVGPAPVPDAVLGVLRAAGGLGPAFAVDGTGYADFSSVDGGAASFSASAGDPGGSWSFHASPFEGAGLFSYSCRVSSYRAWNPSSGAYEDVPYVARSAEGSGLASGASDLLSRAPALSLRASPSVSGPASASLAARYDCVRLSGSSGGSALDLYRWVPGPLSPGALRDFALANGASEDLAASPAWSCSTRFSVCAVLPAFVCDPFGDFPDLRP